MTDVKKTAESGAGRTSTPPSRMSSAEREDWNKNRGCKGETALHAASRSGHVSIIHVLLEAGAEIDSTDMALATPLLVAAGGGHVECVRALLDSGANPDHQNYIGQSVLHYAFESKNVDVQLLLHERGVRPTGCSRGRCAKCKLGVRLMLSRQAEREKAAKEAEMEVKMSTEEIFQEEFGNLSLAEELAKMEQELLSREARGEGTEGLLGGGGGGGGAAAGDGGAGGGGAASSPSGGDGTAAGAAGGAPAGGQDQQQQQQQQQQRSPKKNKNKKKKKGKKRK